MAATTSFLRGFLGLLLAGAFVVATPGCKTETTPFAQLTDARTVAASLRLDLNKAADASIRAVMADTDEASIAFATEATRARGAVGKDAENIAPLLQSLGYAEETRTLQEFQKRFAEYEELDKSVTELAVENTNLKAQRLSFGPASDAANTFRSSLEAVAAEAPAKNSREVERLVARAVIAVREVQVLDAPHIAESDDDAMTRMEKQMDERQLAARDAFEKISALADPSSRGNVMAAGEALDRFKSVETQIVALSRKNTNVRSLMLSLGQERTLFSACDASVGTLTDALARRGFTASR